MSPAEAVQVIADMPDEVVGFMLTMFALRHPRDFEKFYLEGTLHHG